MEDVDETQQKQRKLLYLESLRGIAAVAVVLSHVALGFFPAAARGAGVSPAHTIFDTWVYDNPLDLLIGGHVAVCIFFIMSSFVLVRPYMQSRNKELITKAAYRRYFRLMPPVALSLFLGYLLLKLHLFTNQHLEGLTGSQWLATLWPFAPHLHDVLYQMFIGAFFNNQVTYNPLLWTMTVEFLGSMLIFAAASLFGDHPKRWLVYLVLAITFARSYYLGFLLGLALADFSTSQTFRGWQGWLRQHKSLPVLALVIGLLLGSYPSDGAVAATAYGYLPIPHFDSLANIVFWHTLGGFLIVAGIMLWPAAQKRLSWAPLVRLGRMSFSMYLTHLMILCTVGTGAFVVLRQHFGYRLSALVALSVTALTILVVAHLYCEYVDQRAIRWSREIGGWLSSRARPSLPGPAPLPVPVPSPEAAAQA